MGDADRLPVVVPVHLGVLVHRGDARHRSGSSRHIPGGDMLRVGPGVHAAAGPEAPQAGLHAPHVPGHRLCEHVLLRPVAQHRPLHERQLVGRHGARDLVDHRVDDRLHSAVRDGVSLASARHVRQEVRHGRHPLPGGPQLRGHLGDDGGVRRFRRRRFVHGLRCQRYDGRPHRGPDRRDDRHRLRLRLSGSFHRRGPGVRREDRQGCVRRRGWRR